MGANIEEYKLSKNILDPWYNYLIISSSLLSDSKLIDCFKKKNKENVLLFSCKKYFSLVPWNPGLNFLIFWPIWGLGF